MFKKLVLLFLLLTFAVGAVSEARAQAGARQVPLGFCAMSSMSAATLITTTSCVFSTFSSASVSGPTLTVTTMSSGAVAVGQQVVGVTAGTYVTAFTTGTGQAGQYSLSQSATGTPTGTAGIPQGATYAVFCAYVQGVVWQDAGTTPTGTPGTGGQALGVNQCMGYDGSDFTKLQFIQQASGAVLGVTFYR